jgi:hypothetical protein
MRCRFCAEHARFNPDLILEISLAMAQEKRRFSEPTEENAKSEDQPKIS